MVKQTLTILLLLLFSLTIPTTTHGRKPHVINFRSPNLYPESFTWDPKSDHFIVASLLHPHLISVSDAAVVSTLLTDDALPANSSFLGISLDPRHSHRRLLAVVHSRSPPFSALAAYDLPSFRRLFLTPLAADDLAYNPLANAVSVDYSGNAYVTDSSNDVIFKVDEAGEASILSRSKVFKSDSIDRTAPYNNRGLNGVVYNSKGYLLVTQSNTGKLFKVNVHDGTARRVLLNKELTAADGIAVRKDDVVLVVSASKLYFLKSDDSWSEGVVFDETALDEERQASDVAVGAEDRVYVLYGHVNEGIMGISEIESEKENEDENVWIFVLIGLGLAYFMFWRFQMRQLVHNMNKKTT